MKQYAVLRRWSYSLKWELVFGPVENRADCEAVLTGEQVRYKGVSTHVIVEVEVPDLEPVLLP